MQTGFFSLAAGAVLAATQLTGQGVIQLRVPPPAPGAPAFLDNVMYQSAPAGSAGTRVMAFDFFRSEFGSGEVVKGAPYSAEAVTESVQTLADGNRIVHRDTTVLARDSEGRTRRDMTLPGMSGAAASDAPAFSFLFDAPANISYTLDHATKTARKSTGRAFVIHAKSATTAAPAVPGAPDPPQPPPPPGVEEGQFIRRGSIGGMISAGNRVPAGKSESLGKQSFEGVTAEGTRTTTVIPAGQIGNERPIEMVNERWYSPELQLVVLSKHKDPRIGETTYKLTNLRRSEPLKSLFEVPADYTVVAAQDRMPRPPIPPMPPKE